MLVSIWNSHTVSIVKMLQIRIKLLRYTKFKQTIQKSFQINILLQSLEWLWWGKNERDKNTMSKNSSIKIDESHSPKVNHQCFQVPTEFIIKKYHSLEFSDWILAIGGWNFFFEGSVWFRTVWISRFSKHSRISVLKSKMESQNSMDF